MSIHTVRQKLLGRAPSVTGVTMRYDRETNLGEVYTAIVDGKQVVVTVPAMTSEDEIVSRLVDKMAAPAQREIISD